MRAKWFNGFDFCFLPILLLYLLLQFGWPIIRDVELWGSGVYFFMVSMTLLVAVVLGGRLVRPRTKSLILIVILTFIGLFPFTQRKVVYQDMLQIKQGDSEEKVLEVLAKYKPVVNKGDHFTVITITGKNMGLDRFNNGDLWTVYIENLNGFVIGKNYSPD